ncbi:MAG: hypothetical protein QOJ02_3650 [Acidobacteriota bacterium]|jgi:hypothetical protein|nr:hypothetical protein [Acidobacteriota bacterium]
MLNSFSLPKRSHSHLARFFLFALALALTSGCAALFGVKVKVTVTPLLGPLAEANTPQLIAEVNRLAAVRSIKGKIDIQIQDNSFAESGLAEKYKTADGTVYLQRPGQIYLRIQAPFIGTDIAQMTSDGEHFRVAVVQGDEKLRRFVLGTNAAVYPKLAMDDYSKGDKKKKGNKGEQTVSVLSSLRPQHFTDALMVLPIQPRDASGLVYARTEFYQEEADTRPRAKKDERVVRGYYLLDELAPGGDTGARLLRRFWFDRVSGIRLARVQTFDKDGMLVSDVSYTDPKNFGEDGRLVMPSRIELTRPHDRYKLSVTYQAPEAVVLDREYQPNIFVLENKWKLPELNLDEREKQRAKGSDK